MSADRTGDIAITAAVTAAFIRQAADLVDEAHQSTRNRFTIRVTCVVLDDDVNQTVWADSAHMSPHVPDRFLNMSRISWRSCGGFGFGLIVPLSRAASAASPAASAFAAAASMRAAGISGVTPSGIPETALACAVRSAAVPNALPGPTGP